MVGLIVIVALVVPALLCWLILRSRQKSQVGDEGFEGEYDRAPLNPVPLREYTPMGDLQFPNPPPGYTSGNLLRD